MSSTDEFAYWRQHLTGLSSIQLPTDYPRGLGRKFVEAEEVLEPDLDTCKRILRLSLDQETDTTPFTVVLSIFLIALHKFSAEEDVVIGSSSSSSNALVLRLGIRGDMTFTDVIAAVQREEQLAEQHEVDFAALMDALRTPDRDSSLCQVRFFNMVDVTRETLDAVGSCDWSVFIEQKADAKRILPLKIRVSYNALLFSRARMQEFLNQIQFITQEVVRNAKVLVDDIGVCTPFAKSQIPDPCAPLDASWMGSIQSILAAKAAEHPERPLVVDHDGASYTYGVVDALASRVANFLRGRNIVVEDVVTIYAHRSAALVVAVMGVLKAGATVSIIDPAYPAQRQIVYLQLARPKALVVLAEAGVLLPEVKEFLEQTPEIATVLGGLCMDVTKVPQLATASVVDPRVEIGPDNVSTLSFTSGSTGIPKVSLTHFYPWMGATFGLCANDRFSMLSGIAHDPIQRDIFTPIFFGATIFIPRASDIVEPGRLATWCAKTAITITVLTPAMGQLLTADATTHVPSLRHAFFVGDVLAKRDVLRLQALAPNVEVVNMMGSTETQRAVSFLLVRNDETMKDQKEILPAGRGMKDVQLLVLNNRMRMCGIGEVGEIFFRSPHMAKGYLGLPDATRERFLNNPFTSDPSDRIYKTGDMGRYLPNGIVECMGRSDDQVKIRGFRVELREIDTFLVQHPSVREAVTLLRRDVNEEHRLVAYFVPMAVNAFDVEVLRAHLREKLPKYAIPSDFVPLTRMPLNPNGKIDKARLPFPDTVESHKRSGPVSDANKTVTEALIHDVWSELLPGRNIGLNDNFFDIGGHSVLATRAIFKLRQALKAQDLPLDLLYARPTVKSLAASVEMQRNDAMSLLSPSAEQQQQQQQQQATRAFRLQDEVVLDADITLQHPFAFPAAPRAVFLTGATGFLGAFLVRDLLLVHKAATVYCLVRAPSVDIALTRVVDNLKSHLLWTEELRSRIVAVTGDLGEPLLGMGQAKFDELAALMDVVVHNGAFVHWVLPYEKLRAPNVRGTVEALRLACRHKTKPFHFVSSTSVFDTEHYVNLDVPVSEDDSLEHGADSLTVGYGQSKWVSERLLMVARTRGLPITVTRPGYILGSSVTGACEADDFLWRLMKGSIELQRSPQMRNRLNCCAVDYVSALIVNITATPAAIGRTFHTVNPNVFRFDDFFAIARAHGWQLEASDYLVWRDALHAHTMRATDNALFPLLHFVLSDLPTRSRAPRLGNANTLELHQRERALPLPLCCPPMEAVLPLYLSFLVAVGFLPAPSRTEGALALPRTDIAPEVAALRKGRRQ